MSTFGAVTLIAICSIFVLLCGGNAFTDENDAPIISQDQHSSLSGKVIRIVVVHVIYTP